MRTLLFTRGNNITPFSGLTLPTGQIGNVGLFRFTKSDPQVSLQNGATFTTLEFITATGAAAVENNLDILYFSNEQDCSVSGYRLDTAAGTLSLFQTITTLPEGYTERNTCSQIQVSASGKFLYAPNRGHNSIACASVDASTGQLTATGRVASEPIPNALSLDPQDKFLSSAGQESGRMASFSVNPDSGELTPLETYPLGNRPAWVSITELP